MIGIHANMLRLDVVVLEAGLQGGNITTTTDTVAPTPATDTNTSAAQSATTDTTPDAAPSLFTREASSIAPPSSATLEGFKDPGGVRAAAQLHSDRAKWVEELALMGELEQAKKEEGEDCGCR